MTVGTAPIITSAGQISCRVLHDFNYIITSSHVGEPLYNVIGVLPKGLTFIEQDGGIGLITGKPTVLGVYNVTLKVTDDFGENSKNLKIIIHFL